MPTEKFDELETPTDQPIQTDPTPPAETAQAQPEPPPVAPSGALALTARQYIRAKGFRWERSAGFLAEQAQQLGREARMTLAEWEPRWATFWARPVK